MLVIRRGTDAERAAVTFAEGEFVYTTDLQQVWIGDGATAGGIAVGSGAIVISDVAYNAGTWNSNLDGATKNAIRDIIETILASIAAITPNQTHTGEVTGATALTVDKTAITGKSTVTADALDYLLLSDTSDTGNLKKFLVSDIAYPTADATKVGFIAITQPVDLDALETKLAFITVTQAVDLDALETKLNFITITQAVDLDVIEARVNALDAAVVLKGGWDASAGTFPGGGTAQAGDSYIVTVAGTVDSVAFSINDRLLAIVDNASTGTYAANWLKLDYTDQVLSVAALTGAISAAALKTALDLAGTNSGDQTSIVGISGTKAQFDTAVSDGNILFVGDVVTNATHTGEVTGSGALTVDKTAISNKTLVEPERLDTIIIGDASDSDNLKRALIDDLNNYLFEYYNFY